jgi:stage II sporulation protein D
LSVQPLGGRNVTVVAAGKRRHYGGSLLFSSRVQSHGHSELLAINTVSSREYVESVVGGETQPDWPVEAVKAQAVLAETVLARLTPGATIGDSTQRQLYLGSDYIRPGVPERVAQVWQEVLTWNGVPAIVFYHSTCAGMTSNGGDIFGSSASGLTYLKARKCDYCRASPFWKETVTRIKADRFQSVFGAQVPTFDAQDEAGRPIAVSYDVGGKRRQMSGYEFWTLMGQRFGWDKAPGLRFTLSRVGDFIEVRSTGAGHGVGLCDWGAAEQARQGRTYKQILEYYFPGCSVTRQGG